MELLVLGAIAFMAALAFAPEGAIKIGLVAAWGLGALAVLVAVARCAAG